MNYGTTAAGILKGVGGPENVTSVVHCATRLRFRLKDSDKASRSTVEGTAGVITVVESGGQYQVVIGNEVPQVYEEIARLTASTDASDTSSDKPSGGLLSRFIDLVSSIFQPVLWILAGTGLLKAILALLTTVGWLSTTSDTYTILYAGGDAVFYFLPMFLAITAAKRFNVNQFMAMVVAGALVSPSIIALADAKSVHFLGIPVVVTSYTSSVIPIIVAVWAMGFLERWLKRVLHSSVRNFLTPMIIVAIMVPLTLMTIGPITQVLSNGISSSLAWLWALNPAIAGALVGGSAQVMVMFGLHWGLIALMANDIATLGYSSLYAPWPAAAMAQVGAAAAVFLMTRNRRLKGVAGPATVAGLAAGITEPIIYGVTLPLKRPFFIALGAGAIGGGIASAGGSAAGSFVVPSLITLPAFLGHGNFLLQVIGTVGAMILAFVFTWIFGFKDPVDDAVKEPEILEGTVTDTHVDTVVGSPVTGEVIALTDVADKVFASGALGQGAAVRPSSGSVIAPVTGTVTSAMPHAFGITADNGAQVLVHVGIDTVQLEGKHFTAAVEQGARVKCGDLLTTVDLAAVTAARYDTTVVVVATGGSPCAGFAAGQVTRGQQLFTIIG